MNTLQIWIIIAALGIGSFLLRFSFLGLIGSRPMPAWVLRHLRYTAVAILPALVAPLVLWTDGPGSPLNIAHILAALATILTGAYTRSTFAAIAAGGLTITAVIFLG